MKRIDPTGIKQSVPVPLQGYSFHQLSGQFAATPVGRYLYAASAPKVEFNDLPDEVKHAFLMGTILESPPMDNHNANHYRVAGFTVKLWGDGEIWVEEQSGDE